MKRAERGAVRRWLPAAAVLVALAGGAYLLSGAFAGSARVDPGALFATRRGPLAISVTESGTIKNREQVVLKSEVEGRNSVLTLVPEGTMVKAGDLLVQLDSSRLVDQKGLQVITVISAEAAFVRARESLAVAKSQAESDIAKAELDVKFARLDLSKYLEGEYPQQQQQAEADITIAGEEVQRARDKLEWSKKLHAQRYLSLIELQADELSLKKADLNLALAVSKRRVLEQYTHVRNLEALESGVEQAEKALDRVRRQAAADLVQAESDQRAKEGELARQKSQLEKLEEQIAKCRIVAPVPGMVVYASTGQSSGWRNSSEPLAEGQEVRERQDLIYLPTAASMMVEVKIHESSLEKVRVGMAARVTVDAASGRSFPGTVAKIGVLPDATSAWMNPDLKVYSTDVHLDGDASDLRAGMSCRAEILVESYDDAIYVPVQCVVREGNKPIVYLPAEGGPVRREVEIGLDNTRMVRILKGLAEGEKVLLAPPLHAPVRAREPEPGPRTPPESTGGEPGSGRRRSR